MLDLLIERMRSVSLLAVLTHRPEFANRWASQGHVTSLALSKLTRQFSVGLIHKVTGGKPLPQDLTDLIVERTDGVPLFLEELTKALLESGDLREVEGRYEYEGSLATITVPPILADSLMARLDRHPKAKEIPQVGAAIGREFRHQLLETVAGHSQQDRRGGTAVVEGGPPCGGKFALPRGRKPCGVRIGTAPENETERPR